MISDIQDFKENQYNNSNDASLNINSIVEVEKPKVTLIDFGSDIKDPVVLDKKNFLKRNFSLQFVSNKKDSFKYVQFVVYYISVLLTANNYGGWPSVTYLLEINDIYSWLCTPDEPIGCTKQTESYVFLFTIGLLGQFMSNSIASSCRDYLGPKKTSLIGYFQFASGYLIIAFSGKHFNGYPIGYFLMGASSDYTFFSAFTLMSKFPSIAITIGTIFLSAGSISWLMPTVQLFISQAVGFNLTQIYTAYLIFTIPFYICFFICLPWKAPQETFVLKSNASKNDINASNNNNTIEPNANLSIQDETQMIRIFNDVLEENNQKNETTDKQLYVHVTNVEGEVFQDTPKSLPYAKEYYFDVPHKKKTFYKKISCAFRFVKSHPIFHEICTVKFMLCATIFIINHFRYSLFYSTVNEALGTYFGLMLGYLSTLSCLTLPLYGYIIDRIAYSVAMFVFNVANIVLIVIAMLAINLDKDYLYWLTIINYIFSFGAYALLFGYITREYGHLPNYLLLVGFSLLLGGILSLFISSLYSFSVSLFGTNFNPLFIFLEIITIINTVFSFILKKISKHIK